MYVIYEIWQLSRTKTCFDITDLLSRGTCEDKIWPFSDFSAVRYSVILLEYFCIAH